ncbi:hypothetical protein EDB81DRAFT_751807 [Dactylonectria macrodidyma]|uniref:Uncharacterized protein n=1 Tax=Dactylonectria macrodidyma TaxID=307937 RepID=A0A9P9JNT1_9HYPO|nr:hypothetical protein EDB81DRAFT_751807 [Dactylonectria macrodidyma]
MNTIGLKEAEKKQGDNHETLYCLGVGKGGQPVGGYWSFGWDHVAVYSPDLRRHTHIPATAHKCTVLIVVVWIKPFIRLRPSPSVTYLEGGCGGYDTRRRVTTPSSFAFFSMGDAAVDDDHDSRPEGVSYTGNVCNGNGDQNNGLVIRDDTTNNITTNTTTNNITYINNVTHITTQNIYTVSGAYPSSEGPREQSVPVERITQDTRQDRQRPIQRPIQRWWAKLTWRSVTVHILRKRPGSG